MRCFEFPLESDWVRPSRMEGLIQTNPNQPNPTQNPQCYIPNTLLRRSDCSQLFMPHPPCLLIIPILSCPRPQLYTATVASGQIYALEVLDPPPAHRSNRSNAMSEPYSSLFGASRGSSTNTVVSFAYGRSHILRTGSVARRRMLALSQG